MTKRQVVWRGVAALLGAFAGLCTIFALVVTAGEAWQEHAEMQWPETKARVDRCYLHQTSTGRRNRYYIDCRLIYSVGTERIAAHVYSGNAPSLLSASLDFSTKLKTEYFRATIRDSAK